MKLMYNNLKMSTGKTLPILKNMLHGVEKFIFN